MKRPLRILYVLPYVPSPIRVRPFQIIRHLARRGHEITVVALEDGTADTAALRELEAVCTSVRVVPHAKKRAIANALAALPTETPLWAAWTRSPEMSRLLQELSGSDAFDLAHVEHLRAAHFAHDLGTLPRVLDAVDCITALRRQMADASGSSPTNRLLSWVEWRKLRRYEPRVYRQFARIAVTSEWDSAALHNLDASLPPIDVITNGVDLAYFSPGSGLPAENHLVFSGKMSYYANEDAARFLLTEILPRLRMRCPGVRVTIAGSQPSASLRRLALRTGGVEVTGSVEDLRPFLRRASVALCPLRIGVGIQNKALEAMAVGCPVVCTPLAARALHPSAHESGAVRVGEDANDLAHHCAELLTHPDTARTAGTAARRYVENYHRWETIADKFIAFYDTVLPLY